MMEVYLSLLAAIRNYVRPLIAQATRVQCAAMPWLSQTHAIQPPCQLSKRITNTAQISTQQKQKERK